MAATLFNLSRPLSANRSLVYDLVRYLNEHCAKEDTIELIPYILEDENDLAYVRNQEIRH
jgi:hypothetical protein